ncbi:Uma2 family endonuclease [Gloeobacter morelensis MG652769]|uniref:Uma2 family endonuclease n=2 Tax=Gloeobacter TaxID=33071 RepID=A0ABY3PTG0_9CYAN|nr:Uma2 family endonuclease [Gloeobacter morelensis MG652769]
MGTMGLSLQRQCAMVTVERVAIRLFSTAEYHRMAGAGVFGPQEKVELLEGRIVTVPPQGPLHAATVRRLMQLLLRLGVDPAMLFVDQPVSLGEYGEPVPDIALVEPDPQGRDYADAHPGPGQLRLLIEVSDSSLEYDLLAKSRAYASAGIGEYWVVDVRNRRVHRFTAPTAERYSRVEVLEEGVELVILGREVPVCQLFPPRTAE